MEHEERYRRYLAAFGIADPGQRLIEPRGLDRGGVRFFAYRGDEGPRLKAAVTPTGIVTPGGRDEDDWLGFLSSIADADAAAQGVVWLETDEVPPPHALPAPPAVALESPSLEIADDGTALFSALLLPQGGAVPVRWRVTARRGARSIVECAPVAR